mmetsp:Transcript_14129/g.29595  ORF Transcript_14129/g.29595 Transcript_14129/m.29595 type:complete len:222 (+) Transcript_14129:347-1012(+)
MKFSYEDWESCSPASASFSNFFESAITVSSKANTLLPPACLLYSVKRAGPLPGSVALPESCTWGAPACSGSWMNPYTWAILSEAFRRMACVIRWSATVCWKSACCASRISEAFFISTSISAMDACLASISLVNSASAFFVSSIWVSRSVFLWSRSAVVLLFLLISSMHQSRCSTSSCCCLLSSATIFCIASCTFANVSSCALSASNANFGTPARLNTCAAR